MKTLLLGAGPRRFVSNVFRGVALTPSGATLLFLRN